MYTHNFIITQNGRCAGLKQMCVVVNADSTKIFLKQLWKLKQQFTIKYVLTTNNK